MICVELYENWIYLNLYFFCSIILQLLIDKLSIQITTEKATCYLLDDIDGPNLKIEIVMDGIHQFQFSREKRNGCSSI